MKENIVVIIPARGGSKRIKGKNIKKFKGEPAISSTIKKLKKSKIFSRILVSTDSSKIMKIAKKAGADIPFVRPKNLSDDYVSDFPVIKHCIKFLNYLYVNGFSECEKKYIESPISFKQRFGN